MNKLIILLLLGLVFSNVGAQNRFFTKDARINFNSSTPVEDIIAESNQATTLIDLVKNEIAFSVLTTSFKFRRALMEEHFNENYMESDKFPKSDFKGKIANSKDVNFSKDGIYNTTVAGKLTIHGATNDVSVPGTITVSGNKIKLAAKFAVKLADYKITVPSLVEDKVAKEASIILDAELTQK